MNKPNVVLPDWATRYMALEEFYETVKKLVNHGDPCWYNYCGLPERDWKVCKKTYMCQQAKKKLKAAIAVVPKE